MYPRFAASLRELGDNNVMRGDALDVSYKTIERYLADDLPEPILKLMKRPALLRALADDVEALQMSSELVPLTS